MTTNIDRAADVLRAARADRVALSPEASARALADAGLLAPDLPPVTIDDFDERPHVIISSAWPPDTARLRVDENGRFHAINAWTDPMNPAEARERAYALLALADHAEGNDHD